MSQARHTGKIVLSVPQSPDPDGTVLITGGTGTLGTLLARHLVEVHGARRLLLVSRSGSEAEGAAELRAELGERGCEVQITACDVVDRAQLADLIASIPEGHPLTTVIHAAGVLDDGVISSLDGEHLARVMAPKVDAAINLHELTAHLELSEFIFFSSVSGTLGGPGQGGYAAANAFLDVLAAYRRAEGLPALSLAWGLWEQASGMTGALSESDHSRIERLGIVPLSDVRGLELIDIARTMDEPVLLPVGLDFSVLRTQARVGMLPEILRGLVRVPARRVSDVQGSLARRLAAAPESDRDAIVLGLVRESVASVLGHASGEAIDTTRGFKELGFDSLGAVELRNRLGRATGLRLPSTLVFDYPTPSAVMEYLLRRSSLSDVSANHDPREAEIRQAIASIPISRLQSGGLLSILLELADADGAKADGRAVGQARDRTELVENMDVDSLVKRVLEGTEAVNDRISDGN